MRLHLYRKQIFRDDHQYTVPFKLAENSAQSFNTAMSLSSAQYSVDQLFTLLRLANNLEAINTQRSDFACQS